MNPLHREISESNKVKIQNGLLLLENWIVKLLDQGIEILEKDENRIIDLTTRLVDNGLSAVARRIRTLQTRIEKEAQWKEFVLQELGEYYLICQLAKKTNQIESLDFQQYLGFTIRKSEVEKMNLNIQDQWMYLGQLTTKEENIQIIRNWFFGINSNKIILFIEYMVNRFVKPSYFQFGKVYSGTVCFYPSNHLQRVCSIPSAPTNIPLGFQLKGESISEFLLKECKTILNLPWLRQDILILNSYQPFQLGLDWYVKDLKSNKILALNIQDKDAWHLIALCMDSDSKMIAEYENGKLTPISVFNKSYLLAI
ncbi:MAG: hypothetical protein ABI851_09400 [Saprospiraceae bacterium]